MCKLDGTKCNTCIEVVVHSDSGMDFELTYDPRDKDNSVIKTWLFATGNVDGLLIRNVGDTVWSSTTREEWEDGQA